MNFTVNNQHKANGLGACALGAGMSVGSTASPTWAPKATGLQAANTYLNGHLNNRINNRFNNSIRMETQ